MSNQLKNVVKGMVKGTYFKQAQEKVNIFVDCVCI